MRDELTRLMRLQQLDQALKDQQSKLSTITSRIDEVKTSLTAAQTELEQLRADEQNAVVARKELEKTLGEGEELIRDKRMRLTQIKNDRELQAVGHEVEALKSRNQQLEEELLAKIELADQRGPRIKELGEIIGSKQEELKKVEREVAEQIEGLKAELVKQRVERDKVAAEVESGLRGRYELIFQRRGGLAVVLAKSGTCHGCRMRIPPQLYNELQKFLSIQFCPNCQRILYYEA